MSVATLAPRVSTRQRRFVLATPHETYAAIWEADLLRSRAARVLSAVASRSRSPRSAHLEDMLTGYSPWMLLEDVPPEGVSLGLLWRPPFGVGRCAAEDFPGFAEAGYVKVTWSILVHPFGAGHSVLETRTDASATDRGTALRFRVLWIAMSPFAAWLRRLAMGAICEQAVTTR